MKIPLLNVLFVFSLCFHANNSLGQEMSQKDFLSAVQEGSLNRISDQLDVIRLNDLSYEQPWKDILEKALEIAVRSGYGKMTTALLEVSQYDALTLGKVLTIAAQEDHKKIAEKLIEHGSLIDFQHTLVSAAQNPFDGSEERVYEFYYFKSDKVKTPLMEAARRGHDSIVNLLLEHGADPTLTSEGMSAYDFAVKNRKTTTAKIDNLNPAEFGVYNKAKTAFLSLPWTPILIATGIVVGMILVRSYINSMNVVNPDSVDNCAICLEPLTGDTLQSCNYHTLHKGCFRSLFSGSWPRTLSNFFEADEGLQIFQEADRWFGHLKSDKKMYFTALADEFSKSFANMFAMWMNGDTEPAILQRFANIFSISSDDRFKVIDPAVLMGLLTAIQNGLLVPMGAGAQAVVLEFGRLFPDLAIQFAVVFGEEMLHNQGIDVLQNSLKKVFLSYFLKAFECPLCRSALTYRASNPSR
jgi:hypothetical protein